MTLSPVAELSLFGTCLLCGIAIGVLFDLFRIPRRVFSLTPTLTLLSDLGFCIAAGLLTVFTLFRANGGVLRGFEVVAILAGFIGYLLTLSRLLLPLLVFLVRIVLTAIKNFLFFVTFPLRICKRPAIILCVSFRRFLHRRKRHFKSVGSRFRRTLLLMKKT